MNLAEIMPDTEHYMTYEGSTTYPGCWETVTWIVMNKPIYITRQEMYALKQLMQGDRINPKSSLGKWKLCNQYCKLNYSHFLFLFQLPILDLSKKTTAEVLEQTFTFLELPVLNQD